jgi:hypothetical protein
MHRAVLCDMNLLLVLLAGAAQAQVLTVSTYYSKQGASDGPGLLPPSACTGPTQLVAGVDVTMNPIGVLTGIAGVPIATVRLNAVNTQEGTSQLTTETAIPHQTCGTGDTAVLCSTSYDSTRGLWAPSCTTYKTGTCAVLTKADSTYLAYPSIASWTNLAAPLYIKIECTKSKAQEPAATNYTLHLWGITVLVFIVLLFAVYMVRLEKKEHARIPLS